MAGNDAKFTISAHDRTRAAFLSVQAGLSGLTRALGPLRLGIAGLVGTAGFGAMVKSSLEVNDRLGKTDDADIHALAGALKDSLADVESSIYQVKNRSNQDPLNYPIKLDNKLAALMNIVDDSEDRPTDQSYEVFESLSSRLGHQLDRMNAALDQDLSRLNGLLRAKGLDSVDANPSNAR